jgi:hypothetical protein
LLDSFTSELSEANSACQPARKLFSVEALVDMELCAVPANPAALAVPSLPWVSVVVPLVAISIFVATFMGRGRAESVPKNVEKG